MGVGCLVASMSGGRGSTLADVVREHAPTGGLLGAGAFGLTYLVTVAFVAVDGPSVEGIPGWRLAGLVCYSAHNVETVFTASGGGQSVSRSGNLVSGGVAEVTSVGSTVPAPVYYLAPVVVLVAAGFLAVRVVDAGSLALETAAVAGATVATGYLLGGVVGLVAFRTSASAVGLEAAVAPDPVAGVLLLGVVYPVLLGAVGGAAAAASR